MILQTAILTLALFETTTPQSPQREAPKADREICRVDAPATGSRMGKGKRVCMTASEWEAQRNRTNADADAVKRGGER